MNLNDSLLLPIEIAVHNLHTKIPYSVLQTNSFYLLLYLLIYSLSIVNELYALCGVLTV